MKTARKTINKPVVNRKSPAKRFLGPLFKKLQVFTSGTWAPAIGLKNGGNSAETSSHFVSLPSPPSSELSFHFSGGTTAIKAWNVGREGHQLFQKIMKKPQVTQAL